MVGQKACSGTVLAFKYLLQKLEHGSYREGPAFKVPQKTAELPPSSVTITSALQPWEQLTFWGKIRLFLQISTLGYRFNDVVRL